MWSFLYLGRAWFFPLLFLLLLNGFSMQTSNFWSSYESTICRTAVALIHLPRQPGNVVSLTKPLYFIDRYGMNWSSNWTKFSCGHLPTSVAASTQLHAYFLMPLPDSTDFYIFALNLKCEPLFFAALDVCRRSHLWSARRYKHRESNY